MTERPIHEREAYASNPQPDRADWCNAAFTNDALAEWLHSTLGRHAGKQVARIFGKSLRTAKLWLSGGIPASEYPRVAREILAELDRQEAKANFMRQRLRKIAGEMGVDDNGMGVTPLRGAAAAKRTP